MHFTAVLEHGTQSLFARYHAEAELVHFEEIVLSDTEEHQLVRRRRSLGQSWLDKVQTDIDRQKPAHLT